MQALILAGGEGTRLRPLTINTPKPIVPIGNEPFLVRQILAIKSAGIEDITLSLNYQPTAIEQVIGDGSKYGIKLRYIVEPSPMGTAGAYKFAANYLKETTLVLNGDILTDLDLSQIINHHQSLNADATIFLTCVDNPSAYGLVQTDENSRVLGFLEKPSPEEIERLKLNTINAGVYILEPGILDFIPTAEKYSFEYQLFPDLLRRKALFYAFVSNNNYWLDIGTHERYLRANLDLIDGKIGQLSNNIYNNSIIGENCLIKPGARVFRSIIGNNVVIEEEAVVENSVLWAGAKIGSKAKIINSIIGYDSEVGENDTLEGYSILKQEKIKF